MDMATAVSSIDCFPQVFQTKNRRLIRLQLLDKSFHRLLVETYLSFQPRNSFQGLPPLKDEICVKWVQDMIHTGINIVALCRESGIVGHTALFPINDRKCEMLVVVWPRFQNIGIGTELTRCCVQTAACLGFEKLWLPVDSTNLRARHIYAKCGFEYVSHTQSRELDMVCDLSRVRAAGPLDEDSLIRRGGSGQSPKKEIHVAIPHFDLKHATVMSIKQPVM